MQILIIKQQNHMQRPKIQNLQFEVAKVDLNLLISNQQSPGVSSNRHQKRNNQQATCKRLKYCYQRRFLHLDIKNQIYNRNCHKFNDTNHFYQSNGTRLQDPNSYAISNLLFKDGSLSKPHINQTNAQDLKDQIAKQRNNTSSSSRTKIINLSLIDPSQMPNQYTKNVPSSRRNMTSRSNWARSKSSIQSNKTVREVIKFSGEKETRSTKNNKVKHINPYTKQQYLYFRRKEKEEMKKKLEEIKKKQVQINILKPCQIYQKQLNAREHYKIQFTDIPVRPQTTKSSRKFNITSGAKNKSLNKTLFFNFKQQETGIRPWESYTQTQSDHNFLNKTMPSNEKQRDFIIIKIKKSEQSQNLNLHNSITNEQFNI